MRRSARALEHCEALERHARPGSPQRALDQVDRVDERTEGAGVLIEGVLFKDGG